ncbi:hypothetical protein, partial [Paenibacillus sp. JMULE4]|uniref:hypothetical protein n=1 Tax=Paenibacillus sp. JMULE4 TaxID=2518342 RepID=UPI001576A4AA
RKYKSEAFPISNDFIQTKRLAFRRNLILSRIQSTYLGLNLYRKSELLSGVSSALAFEADLKATDFNDLAIIHFIIKCYREGIIDLLNHLLKNLDRVTQQEIIESKGIIRGSVDWGETFKRRAANGFADRTMFVTRPSSKVYDTSSNQLLKFIVSSLYDSIPRAYNIAPGQAEGWISILDKVFSIVKKIRLHPHLKEVTCPSHLNYKLIQAASKNRSKYYRKLSELGLLYYNLFVLKEKDTLFKVLKEQIISPQSAETLYEFAVFFEVISVLEKIRKKVNGSREITILRAEHKTIFTYHFSNNINIFLYYQHVPKSFSQNSDYINILKSYTQNTVSTRRPDIIIVAEKETSQGKSILNSLIEVKYSEERGYIGEGVHDVLSYLSDFKGALNQSPKALLAVWSGINKTPQNEENNDVWLASFSMLEDSINRFIETIMKKI